MVHPWLAGTSKQHVILPALIKDDTTEGDDSLIQTGVSRAGLIDWLSIQDFRFCMEVNFFAVITVTKAFLPLLKKSPEGRIVNMSSAAGVACGYPVTCAYSSSKHAVELFTSALRQELKVWNIAVSTGGHGGLR